MQDALSALVLSSEALPRTAMNDTPSTPAFRASPASDEHLMLGTHGDNMRDMVEKGRSHSPKPHLTLTQRNGIFRAAEMGLTHVDIASQCGTTPRTVNRVLNGH